VRPPAGEEHASGEAAVEFEIPLKASVPPLFARWVAK
jgi:hypothetical protein